MFHCVNLAQNIYKSIIFFASLGVPYAKGEIVTSQSAWSRSIKGRQGQLAQTMERNRERTDRRAPGRGRLREVPHTRVAGDLGGRSTARMGEPITGAHHTTRPDGRPPNLRKGLQRGWWLAPVFKDSGASDGSNKQKADFCSLSDPHSSESGVRKSRIKLRNVVAN